MPSVCGGGGGGGGGGMGNVHQKTVVLAALLIR